MEVQRGGAEHGTEVVGYLLGSGQVHPVLPPLCGGGQAIRQQEVFRHVLKGQHVLLSPQPQRQLYS